MKIQVLGRNDKPVVSAEVFVSWVSGGHSQRRTNENGIADLETSEGTAQYVRVNGREVSGRIWLKDGVNQVSEY